MPRAPADSEGISVYEAGIPSESESMLGTYDEMSSEDNSCQETADCECTQCDAVPDVTVTVPAPQPQLKPGRKRRRPARRWRVLEQRAQKNHPKHKVLMESDDGVRHEATVTPPSSPQPAVPPSCRPPRHTTVRPPSITRTVVCRAGSPVPAPPATSPEVLSKRLRSWCFTLNNYSPSEVTTIDGLPCKYLVYGYELSASGTPHLQGFVHFKNPRRMSSLSKSLPRAHWSVMYSDFASTIAYCKKDGRFVERGTAPSDPRSKGDTTRARYADSLQLAEKGDFKSIHPVLLTRHLPTYERWFSRCQPAPNPIPNLRNLWLWGPTGSGKSVRATSIPDAVVYKKSINKWFDHYPEVDKNVAVVLDEWSPEHSVLFPYLKIWADHHPFQAERKGGSRLIRPAIFVVTSNYSLKYLVTHYVKKTHNGVLEEEAFNAIYGPLSRRFRVQYVQKTSASYDELVSQAKVHDANRIKEVYGPLRPFLEAE